MEYYFGATGGGLWKTTDSGATWNNVTDGSLGSSSVGAVAVSESRPDVVYIGTGEREIRGDISQGDGAYKSVDAGKTWTRIGLEATKTISRIVVDPTNPTTVYVAALGDVYAASADRGIYKSTDGGATWTKVLFESDRAGAVDLQMEPGNPRVLYAATWDAWRTPYFMNSGGPGSKLWKSTDGGATWVNLSVNPGLPKGVLGKIGISVSPVDPKRVWAIIEAKDGGIFRSDDSGATWTKVSDDHNFTQRAWYFSHVYADPKALDKLYCLNVGAYRSTDGAKSFNSMRTAHSDNHDLWINPDDTNKMIEANDGGACVTTDGGQTWTRESFPTAAIYHVVADNHVPYKIYGAQQDNSAVRLSPSDPNRPDRPNWEPTAGGESGFIAVNPAVPDLVYGGNYSGELEELDYRTGLSRNINPWPDNPMGHPASDLAQRIQWTFPIVFSPSDPRVLYTASQYLLRTDNAGQSWKQISPDLTRNDKSKQGSSGGPITQDNTSVEYYDTIFAVAESPVRKGVIWVGSDDGLVHLSKDGGRSWADTTPPGMPYWGRVSMIEASPHDPGTAYVAVNNYQNDDNAPYIYRTHDFGTTWKKIVNGIGGTSFARVCREDLHRSRLLYAGTETGAFVSFDDGDSWKSLQLNLPLCPVHDLLLKDNDLIAATHGRSFWILHNVSRLSELTAREPSGPILYAPVDHLRNERGARVSVDYYLPKQAKKVEFTFTDRNGQTVGKVDGQADAGIHTVSVSLGHRGFGTFPGMILWGGYYGPIPAPPGQYTASMNTDGQVQTTKLRLLKDPRVPASLHDLEDQYNFSLEIASRVTEANEAVVTIRDLKSQIERAQKDPKADSGLVAAGTALADHLTGIEGEIYQYRSHSGEDPLNFPVKLNNRLAADLSSVQSGQFRPTEQTRKVFAIVSRELQVQLDALKSLENGELAAYNKNLSSRSIQPVVAKKVVLAEQAPRRRGGGDESED